MGSIFDDDSDKIRRNLMALSTAILLFYCLRLPLPNQFLSLSIPAERKIWLPWIALAVEIYFLWRYLFCEEWIANKKKVGESFKQEKARAIGKLLRVSCQFAGRPITAQSTITELNEMLANTLGSIGYHHRGVNAFELTISDVQLHQYHRWPEAQGSATVRITFTADEDPNMRADSGTFKFKLSKWQTIQVHVKAFFRLTFFTGLIPNVLIPYLMTIASLVSLAGVIRNSS